MSKRLIAGALLALAVATQAAGQTNAGSQSCKQKYTESGGASGWTYVADDRATKLIKTYSNVEITLWFSFRGGRQTDSADLYIKPQDAKKFDFLEKYARSDRLRQFAVNTPDFVYSSLYSRTKPGGVSLRLIREDVVSAFEREEKIVVGARLMGPGGAAQSWDAISIETGGVLALYERALAATRRLSREKSADPACAKTTF